MCDVKFAGRERKIAMTTKSPNPRVSIPTVSELLENPAIRALADRWNRSVVAAGVRSFVDELRDDLIRRGEAAKWPTFRELAERAAQHIVATQQPSQRGAINATGRIWGGRWVGRPQSETALEHAFATGREFVAGPEAVTSPPAAGDVESLIARMTGAPAAAAVHSYAGAIWLALSVVATGREVLVSRAELGHAATDCSLETIIKASGAKLREIGATNRSSAADYEARVSDETAALFTVSPESFCVVGETAAPELEELVALARDRELVLIDALGTAPLVDLPLEMPGVRRSLQASLVAGATLAIVRGDGLVGGPTCGIIAGDREIVSRIVSHPLFSAFRLDAPRMAAIAETLSGIADGRASDLRTPIAELLAIPIDNLRHRAERLAPQLLSASGIRSAEAVPMVSQLDGVPISQHTLPSYGVELSPTEGDANGLANRLSDAPLPIFGRIEGERLILDLRTVLPRHDASIVRALIDHK